MTDETTTPAAQPAPVPPAQPAPAQPALAQPNLVDPVYAQPVYAPAPVKPKRPKLRAGSRVGAVFAGGIGFVLITAGWGAIMIAGTALALSAMFASMVSWVSGLSSDTPGVDLGTWIDGIAVASSALMFALLAGGVVLWLIGFVISWVLLKVSRNPRPGGTTWAGLGIAIVASWIAAAIGAMLAPLLGMLPPSASVDETATLIGVIVGGVWAASTFAIGALCWLWMAHTMRPAAPAATGVQPVAQV